MILTVHIESDYQKYGGHGEEDTDMFLIFHGNMVTNTKSLYDIVMEALVVTDVVVSDTVTGVGGAEVVVVVVTDVVVVVVVPAVDQQDG
jgi:ribosomal silencing factor RsfS